MQFPNIYREGFDIMQINLGYKCNQACKHCHVDAGPNRKEMMDISYLKDILKIVEIYNIKTIDLTGGAPELHPMFRLLVEEVNKKGLEIIDRCNLTILFERNQEKLAEFLANNNVTIVASLPCYLEDNVDRQRGNGVFNKSIEALQILNKLGYGKFERNLNLNLVFNPQGASLPPPQSELEKDYRYELKKRYGIVFNNLYTITNMPIKRFANDLSSKGLLAEYQYLLKKSFNKANLENLMCKNVISIDWQGNIYDCDFNQQLGLNLGSLNIRDLASKKYDFKGNKIVVGDHCFGCTAGSGSSCGGSLS